MQLTLQQLNRAALGRQLLLRREPVDVVTAVHRVVALQGQEPASPYIALWNRIAEFDPADLHHAFQQHRIVKATLMRVTIHLVAASDYATFHEAMQSTLRAARLGDKRFTSEGVSLDDLEALLPDLLAFTAEARRNADVERWLEERYGTPKPRVWWALRQQGPFVHAATGGPWSFGPRPAYVAAPEQHRQGDRVASLGHLVQRYLAGFGPASVQDIAAFGLIYRPLVREAIAVLGDKLVRLEGPGGALLYDVPDGLFPPEDSPAPPRLMAMWDSTLLAWADRTRIIPPDYRRLVIQNNGDVLPTLLVDGRVAGVWRQTDAGIEATAFHDLDADAWESLDTEARGLRAFLADREGPVNRRYDRWWQKLAGRDVRILGADGTVGARGTVGR